MIKGMPLLGKYEQVSDFPVTLQNTNYLCMLKLHSNTLLELNYGVWWQCLAININIVQVHMKIIGSPALTERWPSNVVSSYMPEHIY